MNTMLLTFEDELPPPSGLNAFASLERYDGDPRDNTAVMLTLRYIADVAEDVTPERLVFEAGQLLRKAQLYGKLTGVKGYIGQIQKDDEGNQLMRLIIYFRHMGQAAAVYLADTLGMYWAVTITDGDGRYENTTKVPEIVEVPWPKVEANAGVMNWVNTLVSQTAMLRAVS